MSSNSGRDLAMHLLHENMIKSATSNVNDAVRYDATEKSDTLKGPEVPLLHPVYLGTAEEQAIRVKSLYWYGRLVGHQPLVV